MKTLKLIVFTLCFAAVANFASAQSNNNSLVGKATAAAHNCINAARQPGYDISAETETVSICFAGGFITKVPFTKVLYVTRSHVLSPLLPLLQR